MRNASTANECLIASVCVLEWRGGGKEMFF